MRKPHTLTLLLLFAFFFACEKDNELSLEEKQQKSALTAIDFAQSNRIFNDIIDLVDEQAKQQPQLSGLASNGQDSVVRKECLQVTFNQTGEQIVFPATMTLDFGSGCLLPDGRSISGKIIAIFSNELLDDRMNINLSFEDLVMDGFQVEGSQRVEFDGINQNGQFVYEVTTIDGLVRKPTGGVIEYRGTTWRSWVEGASTNFFRDGIEGITDDVWEIIGFTEGFNSNVNSFSVQMHDPVRRSLGCRWLLKGEVVVKTTGLRLTTRLKYGPEEEAECDNVVILTAGTYVEEVEL